MILIDNYDSFTYNIVQYLQELGIEPKIFENDKITFEELKQLKFNSIIISPGAGSPDTAGISLEVIKEFYKTKKILGICLGHQCIAQFFGAEIIKSVNPTHGKTSKIYCIRTQHWPLALRSTFIWPDLHFPICTIHVHLCLRGANKCPKNRDPMYILAFKSPMAVKFHMW